VRAGSPIYSKPKGWKADFTVETTERIFYLFAPTNLEKKKWLRALLQVKTDKNRYE